jgi:hypothetical protein
MSESSKFLSLDWFKQKIESTVEKVITSRMESLIEEENNSSFSKVKILNAKLINDSLIVVLEDGFILTKNGATEEDYRKVITCSSIDEINKIMASKEIISEVLEQLVEKERITSLSEGFKLLSTLSDFKVIDNSVYLVTTQRTLPQLLVDKFLQVIYAQRNLSGLSNLEENLLKNEEYQSLKRFFMWCCLNPRAEVANELYRFLSENSFRITKQGFFVALRNVVTLHGSPELVHFVSNAYNKVKAVWKKSPDKYSVFLSLKEYKLIHEDDLTKTETYTSTICEDCDGEYYDFDDEYYECDTCNKTGKVEEYEYTKTVFVNHGQLIGGLTELYLDLPNREENRFTDDWTKTFDIRIGKLTSMPQEECNWSTQDCAAAGLHFTADQIHYVGCGDQSVLVLINPMKVVGIGKHKGRCFEYLPIMTVPRNEATSILHDEMFDTLQLDEDYAIAELESLAERSQKGFAIESNKYEFNLPAISSLDIEKIVLSLKEMYGEIGKRVVEIN